MARYGRDLEIPADRITGKDLCDWHVVTVECECGHGRVVDHRLLRRHDRIDKPLTSLPWKCDWCGKRSDKVRHTVRVTKLPRNS